jgi:hypothetical protein
VVGLVEQPLEYLERPERSVLLVRLAWLSGLLWQPLLLTVPQLVPRLQQRS